MARLPDRIVLHIDLDYFYAQIEETENPEYKGKPVVVCVYSGRTDDSGAVSTANYVARRFGVKSGMPISWAKRTLRETDAIFLPVDLAKYRTVSDRIMDLLRAYGDEFEQVSIDEAYLEATQRVQRDYASAEKLAREVKEAILRETGLTCSIGVGPNKLISKIAANMVKPDGLSVVAPDSVEEFLKPLPLARLYGVGRKTESIFTAKGLKTIGDLANYPLNELINTFGKTIGTYFHKAANGIDESEVQERGPPKSISHIITLKKDTRDPGVLIPVLAEIAKVLFARIQSKRMAVRTVGIIVIADDMSIHSRSASLEEATTESEILLKTGERLLEEYLKKSTVDVRRLGLRASTLTSLSGQRSLSAYLG